MIEWQQERVGDGNMSWLDWAIVAILLLAVLRGAKGGWPRAALGVVGILAGLWAALEWSSPLAQAISQAVPIVASWSPPTAFALLVMAGDAVVGLLGSVLLRPPSHPLPSQKLLAASLGLLRGMVVAGVFLAVLLGSPLEPLVSRDVQNSRLAPLMVKGERMAMEYIRKLDL